MTGTVTELDQRGRRCPLPVIALAKAAATGAPGDLLAVLADDPAARHDIPAWCRMRGHAFVSDEPLPDGVSRLTVRLVAAVPR